jgi:predicted ABC-type ATPase
VVSARNDVYHPITLWIEGDRVDLRPVSGVARPAYRVALPGLDVEDLDFLALPSADMALQRVAERVRQGGHHIPENTIRRRVAAGLRLLKTVCQPLVNEPAVYDNSGGEPQFLDWSPRP